MKFKGQDDSKWFINWRTYSLGGTKSERIIKQIKDALRLPSETDWYLVLAAADRLQPGIFRAVEGDVAVVTQRFQMLMEYF